MRKEGGGKGMGKSESGKEGEKWGGEGEKKEEGRGKEKEGGCESRARSGGRRGRRGEQAWGGRRESGLLLAAEIFSWKAPRTRTQRGGRSLFQPGLRLKFNRNGSQAS